MALFPSLYFSLGIHINIIDFGCAGLALRDPVFRSPREIAVNLRYVD